MLHLWIYGVRFISSWCICILYNDILKLVIQVYALFLFLHPRGYDSIGQVSSKDQISIIECQEAKDLKEMMVLIVLHAGRLLVLLKYMALQHHWIRMLFVTWLNNIIFANKISRASCKKNCVIFFESINPVIYIQYFPFLCIFTSPCLFFMLCLLQF